MVVSYYKNVDHVQIFIFPRALAPSIFMQYKYFID